MLQNVWYWNYQVLCQLPSYFKMLQLKINVLEHLCREILVMRKLLKLRSGWMVKGLQTRALLTSVNKLIALCLRERNLQWVPEKHYINVHFRAIIIHHCVSKWRIKPTNIMEYIVEVWHSLYYISAARE